MDKIDHFSHEHPLTLIEFEKKIRRKNHTKIRCKGCEKLCTGLVYACSECSFYLHKSCAELPKEFRNPFHPHPLTLVLDSDISFACQACFKACSGFYYHCEVCCINLDVDCALLMPTIEEGRKQLLHFIHLHPLALSEKKDNNCVKCLVCGEYCLGLSYGCEPCGIFLHQPCAEFQYQQEIRHLSHPCPLTLQTQVTSFCCKACNTYMLGICYHCERCAFWIDVECALSNNIESQGQEQIKHFSHRHPLKLVEKMEDRHQVYCFACGTCCVGPTYVCNKCRFSLHKSCASSPSKIFDLLHPDHPLTLLVTPAKYTSTANEELSKDGFRCNVCCNDCEGALIYRCDLCDFTLHDQCTGLVPTIKFDDHEHLLIFVEKIGLGAKCDACDTEERWKKRLGMDFTCNSSLLRCPQCNFNLHLECGPLPNIIKHKCHIDSLTLVESPVEEEDSDDEFYCDVCEEQRDPQLPVYYCADCRFVAEVECVIPEVILWLKGEYGDVELRTPEGGIAGKVISRKETGPAINTHSEPQVDEAEVKPAFTLGDVFNLFNEMYQKEAAPSIKIHSEPEVEKMEVKKVNDHVLTLDHLLKSFSEDEEKELKDVLENEDILEDEETETTSTDQENSEISLFLDNKYMKFMQKLDSEPEALMNFWEEKEEVVYVEDYLVTRSLAPVLEDLFVKYGDISGESTVTPRVKMCLFVILCGTLDSMCKTKMQEISEDILFSWWKYLKQLQYAGFKIQFAFDRLKRVAKAYYGLHLINAREETLTKLDEDIEKYSAEVEKSTTTLEQLKLEREHMTLKSSLFEECRREALRLKWRKAGEGLQLNKLA